MRASTNTFDFIVPYASKQFFDMNFALERDSKYAFLNGGSVRMVYDNGGNAFVCLGLTLTESVGKLR